MAPAKKAPAAKTQKAPAAKTATGKSIGLDTLIEYALKHLNRRRLEKVNPVGPKHLNALPKALVDSIMEQVQAGNVDTGDQGDDCEEYVKEKILKPE